MVGERGRPREPQWGRESARRACLWGCEPMHPAAHGPASRAQNRLTKAQKDKIAQFRSITGQR